LIQIIDMLTPDESIGKSAEMQHELEATELDAQLAAMKLEVELKNEKLKTDMEVTFHQNHFLREYKITNI
jgi:hypothetical protein